MLSGIGISILLLASAVLGVVILIATEALEWAMVRPIDLGSWFLAPLCGVGFATRRVAGDAVVEATAVTGVILVLFVTLWPILGDAGPAPPSAQALAIIIGGAVGYLFCQRRARSGQIQRCRV